MAAPSVTYTFVNATTSDATQVNQNFSDIINALTDGSKTLTISSLTMSGTFSFSALTASSLVATDASKQLTSTVSGLTPGFTGMTLSGLTASLPVFSNGSKALVSNAMTGTGNVVMSASPTLTGTIGAAAMTLSSTLTATGNVVASANLGVGLTPGTDFHVQKSKSASTVYGWFENTSNSASSDAAVLAIQAGASGGDAYFGAQVSSGQKYSWGVDISDSSAWVLSANAALGTSNAIRVSSSAVVSFPGAFGSFSGGGYEEGTFTATYVGGTTAPTGTASYVRIGKAVTLVLPLLSATSNSTGFSLTGLPASLWPATNQGVSIGANMAIDNSVAINTAKLFIGLLGTLIFQNNGSSNGWTAAGTKSIAGGVTANIPVQYTLQ